MAVQISPFMTMAQQYNGLVGWDGELVVHVAHTVHGQKSRRVPAGAQVDLSEVGVLVSWPGAAPTGVLIPWGEITAIEQVTPADSTPE